MALIKQDRLNFWMIGWLDEFMMGHKGFICGGCFKNIFQKEKVKDLDIFFESRADFDEAVQWFDSMTPGYEGDDKREEKYTFFYQNDNVKAYKHKDKGITIELCCKIFGKPEEIISQFDFTITKFAYFKEEVPDEPIEDIDPWDIEAEAFGMKKEQKSAETHIEYMILMDDKFFEHLHLHRLVTDDQIPYPMSTFERMMRYARYGYFPCKETKMKIARAIHDLPEAAIETSENLYDGMD